MSISLAIAEDNSFALKVCLSKLALFPEFKVVLTSFNGEELAARISEHPVDLVLMDIQMPGMGGIACTRLVKQNHPHIKIVMLTTFDDDDSIFEAILAGASGYLLKEETAESLHQAILDTIHGGAAMSPGIALKVLHLLRSPEARPTATTQEFNLTKREIELLEQLKNGLSYEQIAQNLFISYGTVRKHIENIYRKLQVNNKVQAIQKAHDNHLF
ncbi:response regulator transcription factor [Rufibacter sp. LB8]|uniref:response regulator transcription factor n=1 Tax=Rufibacter sp. LB8 TaxID=2777781 RepID=UPI00178C228B|nr:response regulator transcription factor [Rufibacter sp. LB8]